MNWLTNWMMREGPGIPRNAPKKTGLALFCSIILREAWDLFRLNLLMLVFSVPLITAPAAFAAGMRVTTLMVDDENIWLWCDFRRAFRLYLVRAAGWGLAAAVLLALAGYAVFIYVQMAKQSLVFAIPVAIGIGVATGTAMTAVYLFQLMVRSELAGLRLLRAALIAVLARPLPVLAALVFVAALWLVHIAFYPATIFTPVIFNLSLGTLALAFAAFRVSEFAPGLAGARGQKAGTNETETAHIRA